MRVDRILAVLALAVCVAACKEKPPRVSDTGYRGTWSRSFPTGRSTIAIWTDAENRSAFRWNLLSKNGDWVVRCSWEGECEEFRGPAKVASYRFRSWIDPDSKKLMVEGHHEILDGPSKGDKSVWTDELEVVDGGLKLHAWTIERDGARFERGQGAFHEFEKVSDSVPDPPQNLAGAS